MHDIVTGFWQPNSFDAGLATGFGATINVINGDIECGTTASTQGHAKATNRATYYKSFMTYFAFFTSENLDCSSSPTVWPAQGAGALAPSYFDKDWSNAYTCKPVTY
jgi:hypothetical protein